MKPIYIYSICFHFKTKAKKNINQYNIFKNIYFKIYYFIYRIYNNK